MDPTSTPPAAIPPVVGPRELRDPLEDCLGYQFRRASLITMAALADAFEPLGLRMVEAIIVRFVEANPGCNQAEVGRALRVKRTNMVPIVAGLVEAGLISRKPANGRTHALHLTDAGKAKHLGIVVAAQEHEAKFFGGIAPLEKTALIGMFREIRARA